MPVSVKSCDLSRITLAILAGGLSARMGRAKAALTIGAKPILQHLLDRAGWPGPTLLVTAPGLEHPPGCERCDREVSDPISGQGPLRGLLTALEHTETELLVVVPIDMPAISAEPLAWMCNKMQGYSEGPAGLMLQRKADGRILLEPFPAVFRGAPAVTLVQEQMAAGQMSLHGLATSSRIMVEECPTDWPVEFWTNLNFPSDLSEFERRDMAGI